MKNFNFSDCRKATNQAIFRPTAARKAEAVKLLTEALDFINNLEEVVDKPSKKAGKKGRRKTTKRTPSQKVADSMDRAALKTNEVGPVKPSKKAKTASVKEAKASLKEMDAKNAAKKQAKLDVKAKALKTATAERSEAAAQPSVDESRMASLEAKIEALTACLALHMESTTLTSPSNEVSIDELPF